MYWYAALDVPNTSELRLTPVPIILDGQLGGRGCAKPVVGKRHAPAQHIALASCPRTHAYEFQRNPLSWAFTCTQSSLAITADVNICKNAESSLAPLLRHATRAG